MDEIIKLLKDPPKEYRSLPFWSWNDKLEPDTLKWQIEEMSKAGVGGYFMHARAGLQTEYLSEEWMECIKTCVEHGKSLGLDSWCYDEEGWPSGFAGGKVTALGDSYHMRWLEMEVLTFGEVALDASVLGVYIEEATGTDLSIRKISTDEKNDEHNKVIVIKHESNKYYIDILNPEVVKKFIDITYNEYYKRFSEEFGEGIKGFFTDEPQFARRKIPWSYTLAFIFKEKYGYDLLEVLPYLFFHRKGFEKVRYDYWALVSELFTTSFAKQIYNWCDSHNCMFTGHFMGEDNLKSQMESTAGVMPFYEYMHMPGMDWLGRRIGGRIIAKQVSSAASQLGKKFAVTETFAMCGWDVSFEELKWVAEWQFANGINKICQHLEGYSIRGMRKRDYPPSLFYQQPWWEEYKVFNDYFARLSLLLSSGKSAAQVLVLHPMKSGWILYDKDDNKELDKVNEHFEKLTETLAQLHIDYHYGDETIIKAHGSIEKNMLKIGECSYKVVIMPSMLTIDNSTTVLLKEFTKNGGLVISTGKYPEFLEGIKSVELKELKKSVLAVENCFENKGLLYGAITGSLDENVSICENNLEVSDIGCTIRRLENQYIIYMVNHSQSEEFQTTVRLKGTGKVKKVILEDGTSEELRRLEDKTSTYVNLSFLPMQSYIIIFEKEQYEDDINEAVIVRDGAKADNNVIISDMWQLEQCDLNSLTLDYCSYSINGGSWQSKIPVIKLMDILLKRKENCNIALKFDFEVSMDLSKNKELYLVLETAEQFKISINGNAVKYADEGWWKDKSFKKLNIKPYITPGENYILLEREFYQQEKVYETLFGEDVHETEKNKLTYDVELESVYIVGDFGVLSKTPYTYGEKRTVFTAGDFVIGDMPTSLTSGRFTEQGFSFFSGKMKVSANLELDDSLYGPINIKFPKLTAVISKLYINDCLVKKLPWAPYEANITEFVAPGSNKVTVELFSGNRNLLGPHHNTQGELYKVGPSSFTDTPGWCDVGIEGDMWQHKYCFVEFGV